MSEGLDPPPSPVLALTLDPLNLELLRSGRPVTVQVAADKAHRLPACTVLVTPEEAHGD